MDSENGCFSRYCRNVSQQRLILYGVIVLGIVVAIILIFTLLLTGDDNKTPATTDKPSAFIGSSVLKNVPLIDGYNSLPESLWTKLNGKIKDFPFDTDLSKSSTFLGYKTDLPRLKTGMVGCQIWTVKPSCTSQLKDAVASTISQLDAIIRLNKKYKDHVKIIDSADQIEQTFKDGKIGSILSINGGHSIDNKLSVLRTYYQLGVRYITLTSECNTPWSTNYGSDVKKTTELTSFGESVVKEMNRLGMIIDLSQSSLAAQKKVLSLSQAPVIFSSSAVKKLVTSPMNIEDDVLKLIEKNKGLVMITFDPTVMQKSATDTVDLEHVVEQINYVVKLIGVDYVGIGSGFGKSDKTTKDLEDSSKYPALFDRLAKSKSDEPKWGKEQLEKLAGLNFLRVLREVEKIRDKQADVVEDTITSTDLTAYDEPTYKSCNTLVQ